MHGAINDVLRPGGDASLQNALDLAVEMLKPVPPYGHREVLLLFAALSTCDPGDVYASMHKATDAKIRCVKARVRLDCSEVSGPSKGWALPEHG